MKEKVQTKPLFKMLATRITKVIRINILKLGDIYIMYNSKKAT